MGERIDRALMILEDFTAAIKRIAGALEKMAEHEQRPAAKPSTPPRPKRSLTPDELERINAQVDAKLRRAGAVRR